MRRSIGILDKMMLKSKTSSHLLLHFCISCLPIIQNNPLPLCFIYSSTESICLENMLFHSFISSSFFPLLFAAASISFPLKKDYSLIETNGVSHILQIKAIFEEHEPVKFVSSLSFLSVVSNQKFRGTEWKEACVAVRMC